MTKRRTPKRDHPWKSLWLRKRVMSVDERNLYEQQKKIYMENKHE